MLSPLEQAQTQARYRAPSLVSPTAPRGYPGMTATSLPRPTVAPRVPQPSVAPPAGAQPAIAPRAPMPNVAPPAPMPLTMPNLPGGSQVDTGVPPRPNVPPGPITDFGPGNDLRSSQINPLASNRLRGLQGSVDTAAGQVGQGPSVSDAASAEFNLLGQKSAEQRKLGIQDIGRNAARLGRLGSGMVTTDLGNLEDVLRTREEQARAGLGADVARSEAENRRANLAATAGLEGQVSGQEAAQRGELRGERGYQADTAQTALENRIRQKALEESLTQGAFGRDLAAGGQGLTAAEIQGNTATQESGAAGDVLANLGLQQSLAKYGAANPPVSSTLPFGTSSLDQFAPRGFRYVNGRLTPLQPGEPAGTY